MLNSFTLLDILALSWFFSVWFLYSYISKKTMYQGDRITLNGLSNFYRETWMLNMVNRDNRIVDSNLLNTLLRGVSFFLSGTILVIAGLYAALGSASDVIDITSHIPFAIANTIEMVKIKFLILISLFVYVFFKLVWSLRLYNYGIVMMGAAPECNQGEEEKQRYAKKMGVVISKGGIYFNEGMRGFEFGLAYLVWLIHPIGLLISTTIVLMVIYRREYRSATLAAMQRWDEEKLS
ncbi:MAG: putative membrane protein [Saprospiraceae bacterium]|jgi:uncharacterized membrane protein